MANKNIQKVKNTEPKKLLKEFRGDMPQQQAPAGLNPNDPTGVGGGTIGTGQAPIPGEQGFSGVAQGGQANTQQTETVGEQQPPMGSVQ